MNRLASRLLLATLTAGSGAAVLEGSGPLVVAGGLLLAFALPGLALMDLMVRGRTLTTAERLTLGPALSLALVVLGGLVMAALGAGLTRTSWTALTVGTALAALLAATVRDRIAAARAVAAAAPAVAAAPFAVAAAAQPGVVRGGTSIAVAERPENVPAGPAVPTGRWLVRALPLGLAAAVLVATGWVALDSARDAAPARVTALAAAAAGPVTAAELRPVAVEVTDLDPAGGPYRVTVRGSNGAELQVRQIPARETRWQATLLLAARDKLAIQLYRAGDAAPYRTALIGAAI